MAVTTIRAGQTTYDSTAFSAGGTRLANAEILDLAEYMDAPDRRDTKFLNSISKGKAKNQRKHRWGIKGVNPRGSTVGVAGITNSATSLPIQTGHGVRFQQGDVLYIEQAAAPTNFEILWVSADPAASALTVVRAQGGTGSVPGTTGYAFTSGDVIRKIGIAMPQLADYPMGPVSRGDQWWNTFSRFETYTMHDKASRKTPTYEESGDQLDADTAQKAGDLKIDLEETLLNGRRQEGDPNPAAARPSMMSGFLHLTELSGNVYNGGGAKLSIGMFEDVFATLDDAIGDNAGTKIVMSLNDRQILSRQLNNLRQGTLKDNEANLTWDKVTLTTGTYEFTHTKRMPKGKIFIYSPEDLEYFPYTDFDWYQEDLATQGPYFKRAVAGEVSCAIDRPQTGYLITNYITTLSSYPSIV